MGRTLAEVLPALPVAAAMSREIDPTTHAMVIAFTYGSGICVGALLADNAALELIEEAVQIAERSADDFTLGHARYALGLALLHRDSTADRERGLTALEQLRDMCLDDHWTLSEVPFIEVYIAWEQGRRGDIDGAIPTMRAGVDALFDAGQLAWCITPTVVFRGDAAGPRRRGRSARRPDRDRPVGHRPGRHAGPQHLRAAVARAAGRRPRRRGRLPQSQPATPLHGDKAWPARAHGDGGFVDCPRCGGTRKPNIVYFGENVPKDGVEQAHSLVGGAEAAHQVGSDVAGPNRPPSSTHCWADGGDPLRPAPPRLRSPRGQLRP